MQSPVALVLPALLSLAACAGSADPITPVGNVDLSRYMGRWYVIASIPGNPWYALAAVWGLVGVYVKQRHALLVGADAASVVASALAALVVAWAVSSRFDA